MCVKQGWLLQSLLEVDKQARMKENVFVLQKENQMFLFCRRSTSTSEMFQHWKSGHALIVVCFNALQTTLGFLKWWNVERVNWCILFFACVKRMAWIQQSRGRKALLPQWCFSAIKEFFISLLPSLSYCHFGIVWIAPPTALAFLSFPPWQWVIYTAAGSLCGVNSPMCRFFWFISGGFPGQCSLRGEVITERLIWTGCHGKEGQNIACGPGGIQKKMWYLQHPEDLSGE